MASREKRPLVPSKSKQKASSDSGLPSNEVKSKKGKSLPNIKQQQLAGEIFDTIVTGSQLPPKLEASLPRKKALKNLKRKQNLRVTKANLIKSKVTKKVTNKNIRGVPSDNKKVVRAKKVKSWEESTGKAVGITLRLSENQINSGDNESKGTETPSKSAKNNLRTKKTKLTSLRSIGELGNEDIQDKEEAGVKNSSKLGRKKAIENTDSLPKSAKTTKLANLKKNSIKDIVIKVTESDNKGAKSRKSIGKELDYDSNIKSNTNIEKFSKIVLDNKNSIDLTIDEVIASMLNDSEASAQQSVTEKIEGKVTRSKKMLVDENITSDIEIKKEPDNEDVKATSDGEYTETDQGFHFQNAIQLRKRSKVNNSLIDPLFQRSLRNGKQRHLSDSGNSIDVDTRRRRLNSEGPPISDNSVERVLDCNTDSCFSDSNCNESQTSVASNKEEICSSVKGETSKNCDEDSETGLGVENNNNSDRVDRTGEIGPTLRSKAKAKSAESELMKDDDLKIDDIWIPPNKCSETQDDSKKLNNLDQLRKDSILAKLTDKSKGRRNSLNLDIKKNVNSFYNADKSDSNSKSQIDQMIENIKLNIAKSIENKIFGPGVSLSKNFDVPKIEEVIAPLSTESQKMGLEDNTNDEDKSTVTENEITSESSENSVPKVADTAKEIEKLVMFDIEEAETHSQNTQESKASSSDRINDVHNICESTCNISSNNSTTYNNVDKSEMENVGCSTSGTSVNINDDISKALDENKKTITTRKSSRISDKNSEINSNPEAKKLYKTPNKVTSKPENTDVAADIQKCTIEETALTCDSHKESSHQLLDNNAASLTIAISTSLEEIDETFTEGNTRTKSTEEIQDFSPNDSSSSEESETLESISREVERLVTEDQVVTSLLTPVDDIIQGKDAIIKITDKECEIKDLTKEEVSSDDSFTLSESESATNLLKETSDKNADGKDANTSETSQESNTSYKMTSNAKHHKTHNNHLLTTTNCDSSSECISVNPVPISTCTSDRRNNESEENSKLDRDTNYKELNRSNDNLNANCDKNSNGDVLSQKLRHNEAALTTDESNKPSDDKSSDEQKPFNEENRRILRARDKQKKVESRQTSRSREHIDNSLKIKTEEAGVQKAQNSSLQTDADEAHGMSIDETNILQSIQKTGDTDDIQNNNELDADPLESQARTRRSREGKRRREEPVLQILASSLKSKRAKRDIRKSDQLNKEETLLDNEVAKINENNRLFLNKYSTATKRRTDTFRFFEDGAQLNKENASNLRSKSENDLTTLDNTSDGSGKSEERFSRNLSENHVSKRHDKVDMLENECKTLKTREAGLQKDSDEASTSGESSNSGTPKILETPEDKAKKESILRVLGLESLEKAAERLNHQRARKEQQYTGTLKTIIRVQKEKDKDKRGSRSPLKMVLKQQGRGDGEGDSPEFYTIQKEFGTSGLGDSSSGANRKFTTNHRHSCDEDNEEATPKDRQSLVIPEKSSSFSIHPGRLCADVCCYCFGKFGSLDTPMHLAQIKSDGRREKILNIERHLTKDSCLCDACYRHVDRKANTSPTNMQQKPQKQHRQLMVSKCSARECRDPARHHVKRRWLLKIKIALQNQVDIDWESSQHTSMSFCVPHYGKIEPFLTCALCKRRLVRNHTHQLASTEIDGLNQLIAQERIPVILTVGTFVCKLCRYFTQLHLKYKDVENMNSSNRNFFKSYRKRILHYHDIETAEDEDAVQNQAKDRDRRKKSTKGAQSKSGSSKSPDGTVNSEKSTPEPNKCENGANGSEIDNESRGIKTTGANDENVQYLSIEKAVEKLKKRKLLDMHTYTRDLSVSSICGGGGNNVEQILAIDKEVTLMRLPKRTKTTNNDIAPVVQRLGANPSISVRTLFPGEEEMHLHANIEFGHVREITPQGWEKCATMIQYDRETKLLWQELQRPYGNQSSFLRHLILLEKYYRSGDLILAPNASRNAINYSTSVQNRLISYEGPEKMDEPIMEPIGASSEYNNSRRLCGGYILEKDKITPLSSTCSSKPSTSTSHSTAKVNPPLMFKLNTGVSIIKKPPPNLQRFSSLPSSSTNTNGGGNIKRKDAQKQSTTTTTTTTTYGGKVFHLGEPELKRLHALKSQKLSSERQSGGSSGSGFANSSLSSSGSKSAAQYQKAQLVTIQQHNQQFQQHLRMQQEMLSRQSRSDFEPLICDIRSSGGMTNENSSTQNLIYNLNLPKSIQVTAKPSKPIPILPKIPKSLTVIPQTITRPADK